jgi:hypothetical protein
MVDILGRLLLDHVHDVVDHDDANQPLLVIHHRQRDQVVTLQQLRHLLLIGGGAHGDHGAIHDLLDRLLRLRQDQRLEIDQADQLCVAIQHVEGEKIFLLGIVCRRKRIDSATVQKRRSEGARPS